MKVIESNRRAKCHIKAGDMVMCIAGGHHVKRPNKGQVGKVLRFVGADRAIVQGLNMVTRHQRAQGPEKPGGKITKEAPIHVSNLMLYVEKIKAPVKVKHQRLADGKKVRGYLDPKSKKFVQIDESQN